MNELAQRLVVGLVVLRLGVTHRLGARLGGEAGEGVISTAIAVLIMAFLGALMWVAFKTIFTNATTTTTNQVNQIGT